ncbi:pax-interacting protein 1 [Quercus suber]|uniref:Pax-interacting protein 1 n=1 Tax=Quercus suber TaxID=58331 RepID=A0AAW0MA02_QUESU
MGSLGDDDGEIKPINTDPNANFAHFETQVLDSQLSPSTLSGEKGEAEDAEELKYLQNTMAFEDTVPTDYAFETQVVNLAGETQELNIGDETQVLDDPDCIYNMDTQLLDEFDNEVAIGSDSEGEGTDRTEVLDDIDEQSDDGSVRSGSGRLVDEEKVQDTSLHEHDKKGVMEQSDPLADKKQNPGAQPLRFTTVCEGMFRASALARMALKGVSNGSCSVPSNNQTLEVLTVKNSETSIIQDPPKVGELVDQEPDVGGCNEKMKGSMNENVCRAGSKAARKLFTDDSHDVYRGLPHNSNNVEVEELPQLPDCDDGLAGLSYADSQEPGELSQANALDFVDRFLKDNAMESQQEYDHGKKSWGKSNSLSSAKGQQSLAKKANVRNIFGETGIFDWDDTREDDGGGDIFRRKKEEFFDKSNDNPSGGKLETNFAQKDVPEIINVGFDTQMAAEAMEALFQGEGIANHDAKDVHQGGQNRSKGSCRGSFRGETDNVKQPSSRKRVRPSGASSQSKKVKSNSVKLCKESLISSKKHLDNVSKINGSGNSDKMPSKIIQRRKAGGTLDRSCIKESNRFDSNVTLSGGGTVKKWNLLGEDGTYAPVAHRTRQSLVVNQLKQAENASSDLREEMNHPIEVCALEKKSKRSTGIQASAFLKEKSSMFCPNQSREVDNIKPSRHEQSTQRLTAYANGSEIDALSCPRRRRSCRKLSDPENGSDKLDDAPESVRPKDIGQSVTKRKRPLDDAKSTLVDSNMKRKTRSGGAIYGKSGEIDGEMISKDLAGAKASRRSDRNSSASCPSSAKKVNARMDESPSEKCKVSDSACATTPVNCRTPENAASPICMGNEYLKQSCKRNMSLFLKEIRSLSTAGPEPPSALKDSRKRRDITDVRVLYSHHLDEDIIKQQKKILARLGVSMASSITDATHFIADQFVRTRNMLEAIASGKPVVTHLWLQSCGQASCFIDEKNYILRDAKKEKEFGFSLPVSLARASQHPLLKGRRVLITPNTKPGKEIISSLVKAVEGEAVERTGRSTLKGDKIPEDLLVLSCEEDYALCVPYLEKGAAVYSSELLLNGIVTQRLEYERHRLFVDHVKQTRSTIWLRKDGDQFLPVTKQK